MAIMSKIETTSKVSLKLPSRIHLGRRGARTELSTLDTDYKLLHSLERAIEKPHTLCSGWNRHPKKDFHSKKYMWQWEVCTSHQICNNHSTTKSPRKTILSSYFSKSLLVNHCCKALRIWHSWPLNVFDNS